MQCKISNRFIQYDLTSYMSTNTNDFDVAAETAVDLCTYSGVVRTDRSVTISNLSLIAVDLVVFCHNLIATNVI